MNIVQEDEENKVDSEVLLFKEKLFHFCYTELNVLQEISWGNGKSYCFKRITVL